MNTPLRVGIVGCGVLANAMAGHLARQPRPVEIVGCLVRDPGRARGALPCHGSWEALLAQRPEVVVECAGQAALAQYAQVILAAGVDLVPASVGALADDALRGALLEAAAAAGARIRIPSGAMVSIDGLAAARHVGVAEVLYRGTMPPVALQRYVSGPLPERGLAFAGSAREAVARFPKNANLTGTIALAGIGFDRTRVEMLIDPDATANVHELLARGEFGDFHARVSGLRISESSPSSRIVAGSLAQAALGSGFLALS